MRLRTRLDVFATTLWSALGAAQLIACGGSARLSAADQDGSAGNAGVGGGVAAGAVGNAGAGADQHPCVNPQDLGNGFVQCDGFKHRQHVGTCASQLPRPEAVPNANQAGCNFDADCKAKSHGWCAPGEQAPRNFCVYGCVTDSECGDDQLCSCGAPVGRCVSRNCTVNADCGSGYLCRSYDASRGCDSDAYACQSPTDTCGTDAECSAANPMKKLCGFDTSAKAFQCWSGGCIGGRPFLIEGWQRLAPATARADWSKLARLPKLTHLNATLSMQLAEHWTRMALMEHASIAAFARFTLQLLSLGAPAELIECATAAMADETKHAKACFAVASAYAGAPLGPGRLSVERCLDESSLQEIVLNTIREGCVGETVAAIEAREAAEYACDPALRELLLRISEDETRHAQLAYRFVQWALAAGSPGLERAVRREFDALAAEPQPAPNALTAAEDQLLQHGVVPDALRVAIRGQAIAEVILPGSRALFRAKARAAGSAPSSA